MEKLFSWIIKQCFLISKTIGVYDDMKSVKTKLCEEIATWKSRKTTKQQTNAIIMFNLL